MNSTQQQLAAACSVLTPGAVGRSLAAHQLRASQHSAVGCTTCPLFGIMCK